MTIKDLAEKTGYSVATISRVLNNQPNVSEKAREEIRKLVEECGYQINVNAKQLKQHANSILVVVKGTANEMFGEMVETIQTLVSKTSYPLHVDYMDEDCNEVLRAVQLCREKKPLGILFLGGNLENFREDFGRIDIPCVVLTNDMSTLDYPNLSSITVDDVEACRSAVDSLFALGHRKIAVIGGEVEESGVGRARFAGCMKAIQSHGLAFDPEKDFRGVRFSYQAGYEAARDLLETGREFTALATASDVMAVGAIRALHEKGLKVPEDVSVIGFDNLMECRYSYPKLTTVSQSTEQKAAKVSKLLFSRIRGEEENAELVKHDVEVVIRQSVRDFRR